MSLPYDVVLVTFNNSAIIEEVLRALYESVPPPQKVIVYDSGSADDTCAVIRRIFAHVTLIEGTNRGFGAGVNAAVRLAESEYILVVNPDLKVEPDCAQLLLTALTANDQLAVVTPLIYRGWDPSILDVYAFGAIVDRSGFAYSNADVNPSVPTNSFSGACFLARRSLMLQFPFDERNFLYYEELDFTVHLMKAGASIDKVLEARCWHLDNYSTPEKLAAGVAFRQFYAIQNRWFLLGCHWPIRLLLEAFPWNVLHLAYFLFYFLRCGKWRYLALGVIAPTRFLLGVAERWRPNRQVVQNPDWYCSLPRTSFSQVQTLRRTVLRAEKRGS